MDGAPTPLGAPVDVVAGVRAVSFVLRVRQPGLVAAGSVNARVHVHPGERTTVSLPLEA